MTPAQLDAWQRERDAELEALMRDLAEEPARVEALLAEIQGDHARAAELLATLERQDAETIRAAMRELERLDDPSAPEDTPAGEGHGSDTPRKRNRGSEERVGEVE